MWPHRTKRDPILGLSKTELQRTEYLPVGRDDEAELPAQRAAARVAAGPAEDLPAGPRRSVAQGRSNTEEKSDVGL